LPRRVLRRLLTETGMGPGARVLDAGCGTGLLTRALADLVLEATGLDQSADVVRLAQRTGRGPRFLCADLREGLPLEPGTFHLIVLRGVAALCANLLDDTAITVMARLLALLRPSGYLLIVERVEATWRGPPAGHVPACYGRWLSLFPGQVLVEDVPDPPLSASAWQWMLGRGPRPGYLFARLQIPEANLSFEDWEAHARCALTARDTRAAAAGCCAWSEGAAPLLPAA